MNIVICEEENGHLSLALGGESREEWKNALGEAKMLYFEPAFNKEPECYNPGENLLAAVGCLTGMDPDLPGCVLESLLHQVFMLGVKHGTRVQNEKEIDRLRPRPPFEF